MKKTIFCLAALSVMSSAYAQPHPGGMGGPAGGGGGSRPNAAPQQMQQQQQHRPEMARPNGGAMQQGNRMDNRGPDNRMGNQGDRKDNRMERRQDRMDGRMQGGPRGEMGRGKEMRQDSVGRPEMRGEMRNERMQNASPEQRARMEKRREAFKNLPPEKREELRGERQRHREEMKNIIGNGGKEPRRDPQNPGAPDAQPAQQ